MLSDDSTDCGSSSDETSDVAYLYLICREFCTMQIRRFSECLTSDSNSQRLNCPVCKSKYRLNLFTESDKYRVLIEREGGDYIDSSINAALYFPEDWYSFYIDRVQ